MPRNYLHNHPEFADLMRIVAGEMSIAVALVEKDYWIMHCLHGLQALGLAFELKGGTSLSKGFKIIDRFSEDIDIRIEPPAAMRVKTGINQTKPVHIESRRYFYDWLAAPFGSTASPKFAAITPSTTRHFSAVEFACSTRVSVSRSMV